VPPNERSPASADFATVLGLDVGRTWREEGQLTKHARARPAGVDLDAECVEPAGALTRRVRSHTRAQGSPARREEAVADPYSARTSAAWPRLAGGSIRSEDEDVNWAVFKRLGDEKGARR